jgi:hypothetical protein
MWSLFGGYDGCLHLSYLVLLAGGACLNWVGHEWWRWRCILPGRTSESFEFLHFPLASGFNSLLRPPAFRYFLPSHFQAAQLESYS